jgi:hypothetical protein
MRLPGVIWRVSDARKTRYETRAPGSFLSSQAMISTDPSSLARLGLLRRRPHPFRAGGDCIWASTRLSFPYSHANRRDHSTRRTNEADLDAVRGGEVLQAGGSRGEQDFGQQLVSSSSGSSHTPPSPLSRPPRAPPLHERQHARPPRAEEGFQMTDARFSR